MTRNVRKLAFHPKTLDEEMVRDSLEAVSQLEEKEPIYLIGGIATQSYLPTLCRRPTSDIDYTLVRPLSYPDFRELMTPVIKSLQEKNYSTDTKKGSRASLLYVINKKNGEGLAIEFPRRSNENFQKRKNMLEREFNNTRKKILEERKKSYRVACPEDLVIPKLVRSINSLGRNPSLEELIPDRLESLSYEDVERAINRINVIRQEAMISPGDIELAEKLRFVSDLYDVRVLAEIPGFNEKYLSQVENEWRDINKNPELRDRIFSVTFPTIEKNNQII